MTQNELAAFSEKHKRFFHNFVYNHFHIRNDYEDVYQEALICALRYKDNFNNKKGSFPTWMMWHVKNCAVDFLRSRYGRKGQKNKTLSIESTTEDIENGVFKEFLLEPVQERILFTIQSAKLPLESISKTQKRCVAMYAFGYSAKEIAAVLNCAPATVHTYIHFARKKMKEKMN